MKKLNNKGFTLIELLAVIVILAILVAIAVPATTRYLAQAQKTTFSANAHAAIDAVKNDAYFSGQTVSKIYHLEEINALMDVKLNQSPYSREYDGSSYVELSIDASGNAIYSICLIDIAGNGIYNNSIDTPTRAIAENDVSDNSVVNLGAGITCGIIP